MKAESTGAAILVAMLLAVPVASMAQTEEQRLDEAMRLQRAVHSQDTAGNLDQAIESYRELAGSRTADRALAAEAQYRLSQALLQKGDLSGASEALVQLSTNFPDQAQRISEIAGSNLPALGNVIHLRSAQGDLDFLAQRLSLELGSTREVQRQMVERLRHELQAHKESFQTVYDREFVPGATRTLSTKIENVSWTNPQSWLRVSDGSTRWSLILPSPNMLLRLGLNRTTLAVGDDVTIVLTMDASGTPLDDGSMLGRVESVTRTEDGVTVFDRAALPVEPQ